MSKNANKCELYDSYLIEIGIKAAFYNPFGQGACVSAFQEAETPVCLQRDELHFFPRASIELCVKLIWQCCPLQSWMVKQISEPGYWWNYFEKCDSIPTTL